MLNAIQQENERYNKQIEFYQSEIDDSKRQIRYLKEHTARIKARGNPTPGEKSSMEVDKRRIKDWQDKIERRRKNIADEKEKHKRLMIYLKKLR
jgi:predicted  nucleic acid-binding Zn-ribbon protein